MDVAFALLRDDCAYVVLLVCVAVVFFLLSFVSLFMQVHPIKVHCWPPFRRFRDGLVLPYIILLFKIIFGSREFRLTLC